MSSSNYSLILSVNYSGKQWAVNGNEYDYNNIDWMDASPKPTQQELDSLWDQTVIINQNKIVDDQRRGAYEQISDPVFFLWQRDEATKEEWLAAVQQVKDMYPKVGA